MKLEKLVIGVASSVERLRALRPRLTLFGFRTVVLDRQGIESLKDVVEELYRQLDVLNHFYSEAERNLEAVAIGDQHEEVRDGLYEELDRITVCIWAIETVIYDSVYSGPSTILQRLAPRVPRISKRTTECRIRWRDIERILAVHDRVFGTEFAFA